MAKVFLALSIAVLLGAAALGFVAQTKVQQKVRELAAAQAGLNKAAATLATRTGDLKLANESLSAARTEIEQKTAAIATSEGEAKEAKSATATLQDTVKSRDEKIATIETGLTEAKTKLAAEETSKAMLQAQLSDFQKQLAEANVMKEQAESRRLAAEEALASLRNSPQAPSRPGSSVAVTGNVVAVDEGLNFVVLSMGDQQGLTVNSPLLVMRGGQRIATLKITSVEPRASIADVVPGTLARGQTVQPGDRVVFAGKRGQSEAPVPAPAPASVPGTGAVTPAGEKLAEDALGHRVVAGFNS